MKVNLSMCGPHKNNDTIFWPSKTFRLEKLLYTFVPQAFCSIKFFAHVTFACIESTFSYQHKEFLIPPHSQLRVPANRAG